MNYVKSDGFIRTDGRIEGSKPNTAGERLYSDLEISYRPASPNEARKLTRQVEQATFEPTDADTLKSEALACDWVASKVTSWNLKDRGGHAVSVKADTLAGLHPILFGRLFRIVLGNELSDPKPGQDTLRKKQIALKAELAAIEPLIEQVSLEDIAAKSNGDLEGNSQAASGSN